MWISHHAPQSHSSPCPFISTLATSPKENLKNIYIMEVVVCHSVSHSIPFCSYIFTWKCSLQWVIGLVWRLWLLLHHQYQILTRTPSQISSSSLCHRDPAALDLYSQSLYAFHQFIDGVDVGMGRLKALDLGSSWVPTQPSSSPKPSPLEWTLQHCPGYITQCHNWQGAGPALPCSPGKG